MTLEDAGDLRLYTMCLVRRPFGGSRHLRRSEYLDCLSAFRGEAQTNSPYTASPRDASDASASSRAHTL